MAENQYHPVEMTSSKIIFMDDSNKIKLVNWIDSKNKRISLRYVSGKEFIEQADDGSLCIGKLDSAFCYDWSSDAFLSSKTKRISPAFRNYFFYLNHNDRSSNHFPKSLEVRAKISEPLEITAKKKRSEIIDITLTSESDGSLLKIANSRSILKNSSLNSMEVISSNRHFTKFEAYVEQYKELVYFYYDPLTNQETKLNPTMSTFSFGSTLVDCNISSCTLYHSCQ